MFDFLNSLAIEKLITIVDFALRLIRYKANVQDVEESLRIEGLLTKPSADEQAIAFQIIEEIQLAEHAQIADLKELEAEKYIRILAEIVQSRSAQDFNYDSARGKKLLEELRGTDLRAGGKTEHDIIVEERKSYAEIQTITHAKIGLMGNPSDGFYGKVISSCITNFQALVTLTESQRFTVIPDPVVDPTAFRGLEDLEAAAYRDGYYGGIRLIYATCKRFSQYCQENGIQLDGRNLTIRYSTNIPRQIGLGGTNAIIVSLLKGLMEFYGLTEEDIPLEIHPNLSLSVERQELGINAGLQDRVVQTYGGTMYMDFDKPIVEKFGHGMYEHIDPNLLPTLFLAYVVGPRMDSRRIHNEAELKFRFDQGDKEIIYAMSELADYALEAREALEDKNYGRFGMLMNANSDLRRKIYGESNIGKRDLQMIDIAHSFGAPAEFTGSGGAVVGMYLDEEQYEDLRLAYTEQNFKFERVVPQNPITSL